MCGRRRREVGERVGEGEVAGEAERGEKRKGVEGGVEGDLTRRIDGSEACGVGGEGMGRGGVERLQRSG